MRRLIVLTKLVPATLGVLTICCILITPKASALVGSQFTAGRIIDDGIFFNGYSMDVQGIQAFLNAKVPVCDTNGTQPRGNTTRAAYGAANGNPAPYTCLKDYWQATSPVAQDVYCDAIGGGTKSSAQIIYDVSRACSVSPKVIIVLLQKEQSLITDDWPWQSQYRSATGYGCPDTAPCDAQYYGFFNQVYNAARQYQRYAKASSSFNFRPGRTSSVRYNPVASCGGADVYIQNQATAGLYNYTPYQPNTAALNNLYGTGDSCSAYGNRNFWRMYNDWFGSPINNGLPSSATIYVASPSGKVYLSLIDNGDSSLYYVPSWALLTAYNLTNGPIVPVTDAYIASSGTPATLISQYSPKGSGAIYLADQGRGFHITSYDQCIDWNLPCSNAPELPVEFTDWLKNSGPLPSMLINGGVAYKPVSGQKQPFARVEDIFNSGYTWDNFAIVQDINVNLSLGKLILTSPSAIKFNSNASIYYFDGTNYHYIPSMDVLTAWGLGNTVIQPPASSYDTTIPTLSPQLTNFVTDPSGKKYIVDSGQKILLSSGEQNFWPSATYQPLPSAATDSLPSTQFKDFVSSGSAIYVLDQSISKKRHIPAYTDLVNLGYDPSKLTVLGNPVLDTVATGPPKLGEGSIVSIQQTGGIYAQSEGKLLHIKDYDTLMSYRIDFSKITSMPNTITTAYPYGEDLSSLTKDAYGYYFYYKGTGFKVSQALASDIGLKSSSYQSVSPSLIANSGLGKYASRFFVNDDTGRIYYGSGGGTHYVTSYQAFLAYGGASTPVIHINSAILGTFNVGPDI